MKKLLALLLAAVMLLTLCACGKKDTPPPAEEPVRDAPATAEEVACNFIRAHYTRDYATRFTMTFYDSRQQWEDEVIAKEGSAEEFFTMAQEQADAKGIEATVDSFDSYYRSYHKVYLASILEIYGKYTMTVTTAESKRMDDDRWGQVRSDLLDAIDETYIDAEAFAAIPEAYELKININIQGEKKDLNENYLVYMVYHNSQWWVASHSA